MHSLILLLSCSAAGVAMPLGHPALAKGSAQQPDRSGPSGRNSSHLPGERQPTLIAFLGDWSTGSDPSPMSGHLRMAFDDPDRLVGRLEGGFIGLRGINGWSIRFSDGLLDLEISFDDGSVSTLSQIPSMSDELDFVNMSSARVQRFTLLKEGGQLLVRMYNQDGASQIRFVRSGNSR